MKFREAFRPFAPSVLEDRANELFELPEGTEHHRRFTAALANAIADATGARLRDMPLTRIAGGHHFGNPAMLRRLMP